MPATPDPDCPHCRGTGWVCEAHQDRPTTCATPDHPDACDCGEVGTPCRLCLPDDRAEPPPLPGFIPHDALN